MSAGLLFIYGPSGTGKTRLLPLIAETLQGGEGVLRVGREQVVWEMEDALAQGNFDQVINSDSTIENLLIDNLWILRSRPAAAKEMGSLIEARIALGNLTVVASDLVYQEVLRSVPSIGRCLGENSAVHLRL